ncbi:MAG: ABC transporter permease subunit [Clostridiales bacterium]|nr:ABC transporter permease subunit [Clostridiales bacterium]
MSAKPDAFERKLRMIGRNWGLYLLILPSVILLILFAYKPMYGIIMAFKDYRNALGIMGSPWAEPWYKHFERFFSSFQFVNTLRNTLVLSFYGLLAGFPFPILIALGLNQMRAKKFKRTFQTISYLPHFISTVVMVGLLSIWLSPGSGLIGNIYRLFGAQAPNLMGSAGAFPHLYVWSDIWQHVGWNSIIYLAALAGVDPSLYEAATVDGASRFQKLIYIDLPMLMPTAAILLILSAGNIMNIGFEKAYLMQTPLNSFTSAIIPTYVYELGIRNAQYSYSAAVNLFNTVINLILLVTVNQVTRKTSGNSLW